MIHESAFVQQSRAACAFEKSIIIMIIIVNCMVHSRAEYDVALCRAVVSLMLMLCSEGVSRAGGVSGGEQPLPQVTNQGTSARGRYGTCPQGCSDRQHGGSLMQIPSGNCCTNAARDRWTGTALRVSFCPQGVCCALPLCVVPCLVVLPCPALLSPALPRPTLPCPAVSCPALLCPVLPCYTWR